MPLHGGDRVWIHSKQNFGQVVVIFDNGDVDVKPDGKPIMCFRSSDLQRM